ncbi:integral component of membrane [Sergentomyia squamirostris]
MFSDTLNSDLTNFTTIDYLVGGFEEVWEASERGGRIIIFDFNPDPTIRFSTLNFFFVVLGCLQIILVFVIMKLGSIITILLTILGLTTGSMLGLFTMGMLVPKANQTGVIAGIVTSIVCVAVVIYGGLYKKPDSTLPMSTEECLHNFTSPLSPSSFEKPDDLPWIFRISFMYYGTIGFAIVYLVGWPVSLLTGGNTITDQRLLAPFLRRRNQGEPNRNVPEGMDLLMQ